MERTKGKIQNVKEEKGRCWEYACSAGVESVEVPLFSMYQSPFKDDCSHM